MPWAKLDDAVLDNPKIIAAGGFGFALHVAAITWCARNTTDGKIPTAKVGLLLDFGGAMDIQATIAKLVAANLWTPFEGGYEIHDYLKYNPSRAQVMAERARVRGATQRWRDGDVTRHQRVSDTAPVPVPVPEEATTLRVVGGTAKKPRSATPPRHRLAQDSPLTPAHRAYAAERGLPVEAEWEKFRDWHQARGSLMQDWDAAWRTWCRRAVEIRARDGTGAVDEASSPEIWNELFGRRR